MTREGLWKRITDELRNYVAENVRDMLRHVTPTVDQSRLDGRLLSVVAPPDNNPIAALLREIVGAMGSGTPLRIHGWQRKPNTELGLALVLTDVEAPDRLAVVAITPGAAGHRPFIDVVVLPGAPLTFPPPNLSSPSNRWAATATIKADAPWE